MGILCNLAPTSKNPKATHIPMIRKCYVHILTKMQHDNNIRDTTYWTKLLLLSRVLLTPTNVEGEWTREQRCRWVMADDWRHFTLGAFKKAHKPGAARLATDEEFDARKHKRATALMKEGEIARAFRALQAVNVPKLSSEEVYDILDELHPSRENDYALPAPPRRANLPETQLDSSIVKRIISQASRSTSPCGISSLRYDLLKQMIGSLQTEEERTLLEKLTWLLTIIVNGKLPMPAEEVVSSTQGLIIPKKDRKARPLGLRETFVNLALKTLLQMTKDKLTATFNGVNYALSGRKKMDELIALMNNAFIARPDHDRVFIDAKNAFNQCRRDKAAEAILKHCPELARIFYSLYGRDTKVWLRADHDEWTTLLAEEGCIQGCVFGPFVFGFASKEAYDLVLEVLKDIPDSFFGAYSDDSAISSNTEGCCEAFLMYEQAGRACGLHVNFAANKTVVLLGKCDQAELQGKIALYTETCNIPEANIMIHPDNGGDPLLYGYMYLGIPVGSDEYKKRQLRILLDDFIQLCACDESVSSPQERWVYLYWVIRQKFPFWLRHMSPSITTDIANDIDQHLRDKLCKVIGVQLSDETWDQARLPVKSHGFGLGHVEDTISAAYVANVLENKAAVLEKLPSAAAYLNHLDDSQEEVDATRFGSVEMEKYVEVFRSHMQKIKDTANREGIDIVEKLPSRLAEKKLQFLFSKALLQARVTQFEQQMATNGTPADKARILSNDGSFAGAWLFSVPKNDKSIIPPEAFRKSCLLRLGLPFEELPTHCCCRDHVVIDRSNPCHFWKCNEFKSLITDRHDAIQNDIKALANSAGLRVDDKKLTVFRVTNDDDGKRPDLLIPTMGKEGRNLLVDITVGHPTCPSYVTHASRTRHSTLKKLHVAKNNKYKQRCHEIDSSFMPLAFESFGAVSEQTVALMANLVSKAAELSMIPYSVLLSYWRKRISTTLQIHNARILMMSTTRILAKNAGRLEEAFDVNALMESVHNNH